MRPLRLSLAGFRSFRAEQALDFSDLGLFAIVGDTGAGKSSILEAIVYALYNKSTFSERDVKQLIALDADTMRVDLHFEVGGLRYSVTRSASRILGRASLHALRRPTEPEYRFDGEHAVSEEIRRVTGLEYGTFIKTVVLPQGRFADLLTASDGDRIKVLGELLGLEEIDRIRDSLESPYQRSRELCAALRATLEGFGIDPAGQVEALRQEHSRCEQKREHFATLRVRVAAHRDTIEASGRRAAGLDTALGILADALQSCGKVEALGATAADLRTELDSAQQRRVAAEAERAAAREAQEALQAGGLDAVSLAGSRGRLTQLAGARQALRALDAAVDSDERDLRGRGADLEMRRAMLQQGLQQKAQADVAFDEAKAASAVAITHETAGRDAYRALLASETRLADATGALESARAELQEAQTVLGVVTAAATEAENSAENARTLYERMQRSNLAAAVAHDVCAGEQCPVCRQTVPADFAAPPLSDLSESKQRLERAEKRRTKMVAELARQGERVVRYQREIEESSAVHAAAIAACDVACARAIDCRVALHVVDEAQALAVLCNERAAADEACNVQRRIVDEFVSQVSREEGSIAALGSAIARDRVRHTGDCERAVDLREGMERDRMSLPERFRPNSEISDDQLQRCAEMMKRCELDARQCAECLEQSSTESFAAVAGLREIERRWTVEIEAVVTAELARADQTLRALQVNVDRVGNETMPVRARNEPGAAIAWAAMMREWGDRYRSIVEGERSVAEQALWSAERHVVAILAEAGAASVDELDRLFQEVIANSTVLKYKLERAEENLMAARAAEEQLAGVDPLSRALEQLRRYLQSNAFKDYIMHLRERRLLGVATEILRKMTAERYAFAEGFQILDAATQLTRDARTLSGGEKFLASLALALGLVEVAAQAGGRLDALFLDEGFGSLDASFLDVAIAELAHRATSGKMIGVITHVRGIAAEIETVLRVQHLAGGSVISRLSVGERERLMDDTLASGLLEAAG